MVFYDGDVPMSLPEFGGMDTGFNWYHEADPSEYDLVLSNSEGGLERLRELGARRAEAVFWGADPEFFAPQEVEKEYDVLFYGYGDKFRRDWMQAMVGEPSRALPDVGLRTRRPRLPGRHRQRPRDRGHPVQRLRTRDLGRARQPLHHAPLARDRLRIVVVPAVRARVGGCRDRLESVQRARALVRAGSELLIVEDAAQAIGAYRDLLADPGQAEEMGRRARERVLDEHTYRHRARQLLDRSSTSECGCRA